MSTGPGYMRRTPASMALGRYSPYRDHRARLSAIRLSIVWLAAFLFVLRAFMPTGFMPDTDALREGHFRIIYCAAAAPMPPGMSVDGHHMSEDPHAMGGRHMLEEPHAMDGHRMPEEPHAMDGDDQQAPQVPGHAGMVDCPFGLSSSYTYVPPVLAVWVPMLALAWHVPAAASPVAPSSGVVAGPPVGSRAPPHRLD